MLQELHNKLEYKSDGLYWKTGRYQGRAGTLRTDGYRQIAIKIDGKKKTYLEHRLCYYYMNGRWPTEIDHIDRDKQNNAWHNLRECTRSENNRNKEILGVHWYKQTSRWRAEIKANGNTYHLGYYKDFDEALKVRQAAQQKYWV
jgi:hypothetical protein